MKLDIGKVLFILGFVFVLSPWASPPVALTLGLLLGLTAGNPYQPQSRKLSKYLLQASVVLLGFGMNFAQVVRAGRTGFLYTAVGITFAMLVGLTLARTLRVKPTAGAGTAICGGSAIAAVGPVAGANDEEMSVALGTVFILNSIALIIFPMIGAALHLSQAQFGLWAALAIHDTSSVVGAATKYGTLALAVGTTVKLARALWIVPLCVGTAAVKRATTPASQNPACWGPRTRTNIPLPWFVAFFVLAAVLNSAIPAGAPEFHVLSLLGKVGLTAALFLIGAGVARATIKQVGPHPLLQGVLLWAIVAVASMLAIRAGWIGL